jgi:hypothetical protein
MVYIIGLTTAEEETELVRRGWDVEIPDPEVVQSLVPDGEDDTHQVRLVWADTPMFDIMSGPDWEKGAGVGKDPAEIKINLCPKCKSNDIIRDGNCRLDDSQDVVHLGFSCNSCDCDFTASYKFDCASSIENDNAY